MSRALALAVVIALVAAAPAWACPSCVDVRSKTAEWFQWTTVLLTLLPLSSAAGLALFLRGRFKRARAAERASLLG